MKVKINMEEKKKQKKEKQKLSLDSKYHINKNGRKVAGPPHLLHLVYTVYGGLENYNRARDDAAEQRGAEKTLALVMPLLERYNTALKETEDKLAKEKREKIHLVPRKKSV